MANLVKHRFVSPKTDGPDATQIRPSNWNDGHVFSGGAAGDVLTRDPTDAAYGAIWASRAPCTIASPGGVIPLPPGYLAYDVFLTATSAATVYGTAPTSGALTPGARLRFITIANGIVTLAHRSATAANMLLNFSNGSSATRLAGTPTDTGGSAEYILDGGGNWRIVAHEQGSPIDVPYSAANFVGTSPAVWTVQAGDVAVFTTTVTGRRVAITFTLTGTDISGSPGTPLRIITPFTCAANIVESIGFGQDAAAQVSARMRMLVNDPGIYLYRMDGLNWTVQTGNLYVSGQITIPIY